MDPAELVAAEKKLTEVCDLLVKSLVDNEAAVRVHGTRADTLLLFSVTCAQPDFGKLLGIQGRNARSLRLFIRAMGRKVKLDAYVKIIDAQGNEYRIPDPEVGETEPGPRVTAPRTGR